MNLKKLLFSKGALAIYTIIILGIIGGIVYVVMDWTQETVETATDAIKGTAFTFWDILKWLVFLIAVIAIVIIVYRLIRNAKNPDKNQKSVTIDDKKTDADKSKEKTPTIFLYPKSSLSKTFFYGSVIGIFLLIYAFNTYDNHRVNEAQIEALANSNRSPYSHMVEYEVFRGNDYKHFLLERGKTFKPICRGGTVDAIDKYGHHFVFDNEEKLISGVDVDFSECQFKANSFTGSNDKITIEIWYFKQ